MNQTPNYQLNQWEADDRVQRTDFNADNAKIDAAIATLAAEKAEASAVAALTQAVARKGNCTILFGTYTGDGQSVKKIPKTLNFPKKPLVVLIGCDSSILIAVRGATQGVSVSNGSSHVNTITWEEKGLSWTAEDTYGAAMNSDGKIYYYFALVEA